MNNNITIWSDKDGVIAVYEPHVYRPKDPNETPLFMQKGVHYYRNCEADNRIIEAYRLIQEEYPDVPFAVITNVVDITAPIALADEHKLDKKIWTSEKNAVFRYKYSILCHSDTKICQSSAIT